MNLKMLIRLYRKQADLSKTLLSTIEPLHEKTNNLGFRPGPTQTGLYNHRTLLEAGNFVLK